ncbi:EthD family reductase [Alicyclobacillus acidocaldarius]|uniref:Ethyl tert-butyl ether degradation EthD n=1 Tax=Alicyclobacillus acidocaldarius subsp. acidocaldarius (strain ATCC 27009 / DSM 446 / BCRC 14685 / JCM 5260 / KCTC 1825 / NBRC 15652 / NCIMB 11725 / NRRL B-14509 / 104-IA) TaxID=521098 RepID=C8WU91_ALIAD|nr:EthD family reductase [Alicyclobacillus acidocaldarius]ACV57854.1 Ethyl tert-butyl ether degradation EthD [Alicyclobacillus acidocaldarius subsp. acidocaldarius DSM 446]
MIKLIALYKKPADVEAFEAHYREVHLPLVQKVPGLVRAEVTRIKSDAMGGEAPYYLMAEMYFENEETFKQAMKSPENKAAAKDVMSFAGDIVTMMVGQVDEG